MKFGRFVPSAALCLLSVGAAAAGSADLILNEWNAVGAGDYLAGGSYKVDPSKGDPYWASLPQMPDGRIEGNGGNWVELVVIADHLDIRGWQLRWAETGSGADDTNGADLWYGDSSVEQGILTFHPMADLWADLRKGTIITISEKHDLYVDTNWDEEFDDRNFTRGIDEEDTDVWDVNINLRTDTSYRPMPGDLSNPAADWWIHVSTRCEQGQPCTDRLIDTETNVDGDEPGDFSVGPDDWQMRIYDAQGVPVHGPVGERIYTFGEFDGSINDEEAGRLEADPSGDVDNDDYDDVTSTTFGAPNEWGSRYQDFRSLRVPEPASLLLLALAAPAALRRRRRP